MTTWGTQALAPAIHFAMACKVDPLDETGRNFQIEDMQGPQEQEVATENERNLHPAATLKDRGWKS